MIFQRKFRIWVYFVWNLKTIIPTSKSVPQNFPICEVLCKNKQCLNLEQKCFFFFEYFWVEIRKSHCHISNQSPQFSLTAKFNAKTKIQKFGTKNALFCLLWAAILKNHCHIWNQRPQICLIPNVGAKIKIVRLGTKNVWYACFWAGIWKYYLHTWNQSPWICLVAKFDAKIKIFKTEAKNALFEYFWIRTWK